MIRFRAYLGLSLALVGALAACGDSSTAFDGGDGARTDGSADASSSDGDAGLLCNRTPIENLNALGTATGSTLSYRGSNRNAPDDALSGLQPPEALQGEGGLCAFRTARQRVFSYRASRRGLLRISTTNAGTATGFDTTLFVVGSMCPRALTASDFLGCNDDDPRYGADERRTSSTLVTTRTVEAGQTVYIGVGGFAPVAGERSADRETGEFELTVQALEPVADDAACDVSRVENACSDASICVADTPSSLAGHCRANGTAAGTLCNAAGACATGLRCDQSAGVGICVATNTPIGSACDAYHQCATGSSCTTFVRGSSVGVCRAAGALGASCRTSGEACEAGLSCASSASNPLCLLSATTECSRWDTLCGASASCVTTTTGGTAGQCQADGSVAGAACTTAGSCTAALICDRDGTSSACVRTAAVGEACDLFAQCATGSTCYLDDLQDRLHGHCIATGALGGSCRSTGTACDGTLVCSNPSNPGAGRCQRAGTLEGACDLLTRCPTGASCVRTSRTGAFVGICRALGSVGAPCRETGSACDGSARCSAFLRDEGICQAAATTSECDPRNAAVRCPSGQVCRATSLGEGSCAVPSMESEPNDVPSAASTALTLPAAVQGALGRLDVDCYPVQLGATSRIFARASAPSGLCPNYGVDLALDLYRLDDATGPRLLGSDNSSGAFNCPRIDGSDASGNFPWAAGLAAGRYFVCVRNGDTDRGPLSSYVLNVSVTPGT